MFQNPDDDDEDEDYGEVDEEGRPIDVSIFILIFDLPWFYKLFILM